MEKFLKRKQSLINSESEKYLSLPAKKSKDSKHMMKSMLSLDLFNTLRRLLNLGVYCVPKHCQMMLWNHLK